MELLGDHSTQLVKTGAPCITRCGRCDELGYYESYAQCSSHVSYPIVIVRKKSSFSDSILPLRCSLKVEEYDANLLGEELDSASEFQALARRIAISDQIRYLETKTHMPCDETRLNSLVATFSQCEADVTTSGFLLQESAFSTRSPSTMFCNTHLLLTQQLRTQCVQPRPHT